MKSQVSSHSSIVERNQVTRVCLALFAIFALPMWAATAPVFSSQPTASPSPAFIGQLVSLSAAASSSNPLTYSWNFGDGTTGTGTSVTHRFSSVAQTYTVTVTATDGTLSTSATVMLTTMRPIGLGVDSDGDGFSDLFEMEVGTDPNDIKSTPLNGASFTPLALLPMSNLKILIKVTQGKTPKAKMKMSGSLNDARSPKTSVDGQKVYVNLETFYFDGSKIVRSNVGFNYTLNSKGSSAKSATGSIKFSAKNQPRGIAARNLPKIDFKLFDDIPDLIKFMKRYDDQPPKPLRTKTVTTTTTFTYDGQVYQGGDQGTATITLDSNGNVIGYSNNP